MREIKFRAWDAKSKSMCHPDIIDLRNGKPGFLMHVGKKGEGWMYDCEVMQYTGLSDKNGKGIYEGDITNNGEIIWSDDFLNDEYGFMLRDLEENKYGIKEKHTLHAFTTPFKVLGNIHENPELIEH